MPPATTTPRRRAPAVLSHPSAPSSLGDGAVLERLAQMRNACQALAVELADTRRRLRATEAELRRAYSRPDTR